MPDMARDRAGRQAAAMSSRPMQMTCPTGTTRPSLRGASTTMTTIWSPNERAKPMPTRLKKRYSILLSDELAERFERVARRRNGAKSAIIEEMLDRRLNPERYPLIDDGILRRLDELSKDFAGIKRDVAIVTEMVSLFVRYYLTVTPPLATSEQQAARSARQGALPGVRRPDRPPPRLGSAAGLRRAGKHRRQRPRSVRWPPTMRTAQGECRLPATTASTCKTNGQTHAQRPRGVHQGPRRRSAMADLFSLAAAEEAQGRRRQMLRTAFGPDHRRGAGRSDRDRGDGQPRRQAVDRAGHGRAPGHRRAHRQRRGRAHHPPGRRPRAPRGHRQDADRLGRAARDRRALRGRDAAGLACAVLCRAQAGRRALPARRLRGGAHHVGAPGRGAGAQRARAQEHPGGRRHVVGQDHAGQRPAGRDRRSRRARRHPGGHARAEVRGRRLRGAAHQARRRHAGRPGALDAAAAARSHHRRRGARARKPSTC